MLGFTYHACKRKIREEKKKLKSSDENLSNVEYNALRDSARILEGGGDPLEELKRMVLMRRLESGIERPIEALGFMRDTDSDEFSFPPSQHEDVTYID